MSDLNKIQIIGNLGNDPELRFTASGQAVLSMSVATNRTYVNKDGEKQQVTKWHNISVWGKQAEACKEHCSKGNKVYVEGYLADNVWEDKEGVERRDVRIQAESVKFLDHAKREDNTNGSQEEIPGTE